MRLKESEWVVICVRPMSSPPNSKRLIQEDTPSWLTPAAFPLLASYGASFERLISSRGCKTKAAASHYPSSESFTKYTETHLASHVEDSNTELHLTLVPGSSHRTPVSTKLAVSPDSHSGQVRESTLSTHGERMAAAKTEPTTVPQGQGVRSSLASGFRGCKPNKTAGTVPTCTARECSLEASTWRDGC